MKHKNQSSKRTKSFNLKLIYFFTAFTLLCSHDLFLKMETYFLEPNQETTLFLYNGTFEKSENIIIRDRMLDASMVAHDKREPIKAEQWQDKDSTITLLNFNTKKAGTYVAGVSTKARNIELTADKFNSYLEHDGVLDILEQRKKDSTLDQDAVESYQKHVKAIFQVGDVKTNDWKTELGYPIEFIPQDNPYEQYSGDTLAVKLFLDGKPLANQLVYDNHVQGDEAHSYDHENAHSHNSASGEDHTHGHDNNAHSHDSASDEDHTHTHGQELRTNDQGEVFVNLPQDGIYYLRTIYMVQTPEDEVLTHQSKWATLSFEVTHKHDSTTHTHDDEDGIPIWIFVLGSIVVIGLLFFMFRKKS
jgi:uncharacterized GH25 family protein